MRTVDAHPGTEVTVRTVIHHRCPFVDELDIGEVELAWVTDGKTFELHALRDWLYSGFRERRISHEDLTREIDRLLDATDGVTGTRVRTFWSTAGMNVEVG